MILNTSDWIYKICHKLMHFYYLLKIRNDTYFECLRLDSVHTNLSWLFNTRHICYLGTMLRGEGVLNKRERHIKVVMCIILRFPICGQAIIWLILTDLTLWRNKMYLRSLEHWYPFTSSCRCGHTDEWVLLLLGVAVRVIEVCHSPLHLALNLSAETRYYWSGKKYFDLITTEEHWIGGNNTSKCFILHSLHLIVYSDYI